VNLPPMSEEELTEIIRIAENEIGNSIKFSNSAIDQLMEKLITEASMGGHGIVGS